MTTMLAFSILSIVQSGLIEPANHVPQIEKATFTISLDAKPTAKGTYTGVAKATFPEEWHGYTNPPADKYDTPVTLKIATKGVSFVKVTYPKGNAKVGEKPVYSGTIEIKFEFKSSKPLAPKSKLNFELGYQMCNDSTCIPPTTAKATIELPAKGVKA